MRKLLRSYGFGLILALALCESCAAFGRAASPDKSPTPSGPLPTVTALHVSPDPATAVIGTSLQFSATIEGTGTFDGSVTWSLAGPAGSVMSAGTLSKTGLYTTPYPAPATVTVTAVSHSDPAIRASVTVTLVAPRPSAAPFLTVDAGKPIRPINPYIYGMNAYMLGSSVARATDVPVVRWGGDATTRYNYKLDVTNASSDYFFENGPGFGADGTSPTGNGDSAFDARVKTDAAFGAKTMGSVPVLGWVAKDGTSCSFPTATYPGQQKSDPKHGCGDGDLGNKVKVTGNDPLLTSVAVGPAWAAEWVGELVRKFGMAAKGGVAIYGLDNEPAWWDGNHRDVHPQPSTYDEVTDNGIATARAVKAADPTAEVSGPVVDFYWNYFYSKKDIEAGWDAAPCHMPWSNPVDRKAHGGVPFLEYYLRKFAEDEAAHKVRLLDYLDLHTYFAAHYQGNDLAFATAGDTGAQEARLNSTRVFWDPAYTDPDQRQSNYPTDADFTADCKPPSQALQVIRTMRAWIARDYPGTKTAITEYNWGGLEHINGAIAQADILGIFGREGLDLGTMWGPPDGATQVPGLMAFEAFRNYDGRGGKFGDQSLATTSGDPGRLAIYAARRSGDGALTIVVLNKTYGDLKGTISIAQWKPGALAKTYLYSNANLAAILAGDDIAIHPQGSGRDAGFLSAIFPAQSIQIFVVPAL